MARMIVNADITIFNRRVNEDGKEELSPTVIRGVSWFESKNISNTQGSGRSADSSEVYKVRIPVTAYQSGKQYIDSYDYKSLPDFVSSRFWTLQKEDVIMKGALPSDMIIEDSAMLLRHSREVFLITSFADNTIRGSRAVQHWRIGGA